jgi:hypothetical protein
LIVRRRQRGQALVLTTALAASCVLAWLLVFNVGQLVNAKLRLNVAADAAAYSAAVWEARSLNYQAYLNRGIVANEVAIAQLVSLRSWSSYVDRLLRNAQLVGVVVPPVGRAIAALSRGWGVANSTLQAGLPPLESTLSRWNVDVLLHAQSLAQQQAPIGAAELVQEVARASVQGATVSLLTRPLQVRNAAAWQGYSSIQRHGERELRGFVELLHQSRDGFSASRGFDMLPSNPLARAPKRGGTDLIGEYAWRGLDSFAMHVDFGLDGFELPIGWGAAELRHHPLRQQGAHGGSRRSNPRTTRLALRTSNVREGYRGVPEVRDLRGERTEDQARLGYLAVLEQPGSLLQTADLLVSSSGIEDVHGAVHTLAPQLPQKRIAALGAAELYFRRPSPRADGRQELPSLFSPYWQARLAPRPPGGLRVLALGGAAP